LRDISKACPFSQQSAPPLLSINSPHTGQQKTFI